MWRLTKRLIRRSTPAKSQPSEARPDGIRREQTPLNAGDLARVAAEIESVASYVTTLRREIAFLRGNDMFRNRLPSAQVDVSDVQTDVRAAVGSVLTACEDLLGRGDASSRSDFDDVQARVVAIMEACCFADVLAQRLTRVDAALDYTIKRLQRFALAVGIDDREHPLDRRSVDDVRRRAAMLTGPQVAEERTSQAAIDQLFAA